MKKILALCAMVSLLSGCCEMSYGPSRCAQPPMQQTDLLSAPVAAAQDPAQVAPQDLMPSAFTPPPAPQQAAPVMVQSPFMMGPSITMSDPTQQKPVANAEKPSNAPAAPTAPAQAAPEKVSQNDSWLHL